MSDHLPITDLNGAVIGRVQLSELAAGELGPLEGWALSPVVDTGDGTGAEPSVVGFTLLASPARPTQPEGDRDGEGIR